MTDGDRAALSALVDKWRAAAAAEQRVSFCADDLETLLIGLLGRGDARRPEKEQEMQEGDTRMDTKGQPVSSRTASANEAIPLEETLWEELGGDLCICQRPEVTHWCESCQRKLQIIREAFARVGARP